jgi:hypothetical protein
MADTPIYGWFHPGTDEAPAGPYAFETLATDVETTVKGIDDRVEFLESVNPLGHMGRTAGFQNISGDTRVSMDSAQVLRGGMAFSNSLDALVVPLTGYYYVSIHLYASGAPGVYYRGRVSKNAGAAFIGPKVAFWKEDGNDYFQSASSLVLLNEGDSLSLRVSAGAAGTVNVWGTTGFDGCFIEAEYRGPVS